MTLLFIDYSINVFVIKINCIFAKTILYITALSTSLYDYSHEYVIDESGGHINNITGDYHCHQEPCISLHRLNQDATDEVATDSRQFVLIYNRNDWPHWIDEDNDCQYTRAEILITYSIEPVKFKRNNTCNVTWGKWVDPYSGATWTKASDIDIDHIVPLKWAHEHGAANWNRARKRSFANDMTNLIPVEDNLNQSKGALGPDKWLPPKTDYHCEYLNRWQQVLYKYKLEFTPAEKEQLGWLALECGIDIR